MVQDAVNRWAVFRFALSYPGEPHWRALTDSYEGVPATLEELRSLYIGLFEAGMPRPKCPLLESSYLPNRQPGEILLENKLFYQHFGLEIDSGAAPDHLLTQLDFLAWIEHAIAAGNPDRESLERARGDFVARHLAHWVSAAAGSLTPENGRCYAAILDALREEVVGGG
ncbi:MAG: molecular chaperone TorD family protein [Acidobacteria bacterium]|nr:molecular chaperone TorD family protein [Acidobacteriota bacterium]